MSATTKRGLIIFGVLVAVTAVCCVWLPFFALPRAGLGVGLPSISLPAEVLKGNLLPGFLGYDLTNSMTSLVVVDAIVLLIAWRVRRAVTSQPPDQFVPRGLTNLIEAVVEFFYNQARGVLGEHTYRVLPLALTIFLFLLIANWIKLIPGVETVGIISCAESGHVGYPLMGADNASGVLLNVSGSDLKARSGIKATDADAKACEEKYNGQNGSMDYRPPGALAKEARGELVSTTPAKQGATAAQTAGTPNPNLFNVIPFFRPLTTDLNVTLGLAIIVFIAVQVWGIQALGLPYFYKFINIPALGNAAKKPMGLMDFVVGLVDIITELSRLISLSFRLLGNMFAGGVLLAVMSLLVAFVLPIVFYGLEVFAGLIQAYVFAILTVMYASQAVFAHHGDEHEEHAEPVESVADGS
jgi:F-type H+-transporting ATPase subunit a